MSGVRTFKAKSTLPFRNSSAVTMASGLNLKVIEETWALVP
jgi:hypothetical protein